MSGFSLYNRTYKGHFIREDSSGKFHVAKAPKTGGGEGTHISTHHTLTDAMDAVDRRSRPKNESRARDFLRRYYEEENAASPNWRASARNPGGAPSWNPLTRPNQGEEDLRPSVTIEDELHAAHPSWYNFHREDEATMIPRKLARAVGLKPAGRGRAARGQPWPEAKEPKRGPQVWSPTSPPGRHRMPRWEEDM